MDFNKVVLLKGTFGYYNRKIYFYEALSDYTSLASDYEIETDINFNPNDGVETSLIIGSTKNIDYFDFCYLLVLNKDDEIISRWYIMDANRNLSGQFTLTLRRDVVAESIGNTSFVMSAPIYVEKGYLNEDDPMIVNDEGMRFNQIKQSELLISDALLDDQNMGEDNLGYIVGYFANDSAAVTASTHPQSTPDSFTSLSAIASATGIDEADLTAMTQGGAKMFSASPFSFIYGLYTGVFSFAYKVVNIVPDSFSATSSYNFYIESAFNWDHSVAGHADDGVEVAFATHFETYLKDHNSSIRTNIQSVLQADYPSENLYTSYNYNKLRNYDGAITQISGRYYKIHIINKGNSAHPEIVISKGENTFFDNVVSYAVSMLHNTSIEEYPDWRIYLNWTVSEVLIQLEEVSNLGACSVTIPTTHRVLTDAPYSMFVIPYGFIRQTRYQGVDVTSDRLSKLEALDLANSIAVELDASLIDLQLLPFMPERSKFLYSSQEWAMDLDGLTKDSDYAEITRSGTPSTKCGAVLFPSISSFSYSIPYSLTLKHSMKIDSQCCFYRLCSPNYSGIFEFNLAKIGGSSAFFEVDCTLKPFNPFIRITPEFNFLYGTNFKDGRGLICGGDFSLPRVKDAWETYELQNKNFNSIFARDIQNLDVLQRQERFNEPFQIAAGTIGAGAAGAVAGAKVGGGYGAIAGAAVGTIGGAAGGALDAKLAEERRQEVKDYSIDRFNLSLANIKALPESLTKVSSYNVISKIVPFLEFYTCTDREVEALENKIIYDGMTVNRIGTIADFKGGNNDQHYFKGQLIRALGIEEDNHFLNALYEEIAKGVYI